MHDVDLILEALVEHLVDGSDSQILVDHLLVVKFKTNNPRVYLIVGAVFWNRDLVVESDEVFISFDDGLLGVWIVEDLGAGDDVLEGSILDHSSELSDNLLALSVVWL